MGDNIPVYDDNKLIKKESKSTCVSARDVGVLLSISPFQSRTEGLFEKCGYRKWRPFTSSMKRGVEQEKEAMSEYISHENISESDVYYPGFNRHPNYEFIGGVPDGIRNNEILVEIKCPERFSRGSSPSPFYVAQMQVYMQIFNIEKGHYVEYIRNKGLKILEVEKDDKWWELVLPLIRSYWNEILFWRTNDIHYHPEFPGCQCEDCRICKNSTNNINVNNIKLIKKNKKKKKKKYNNYSKIKRDWSLPSIRAA